MRTIKILEFVLIGLLVACNTQDKAAQDFSANRLQSEYEISAVDSSPREIVIKSIIRERLTKEDLINIAHSEKIKRNWNKKLTVYFYLHSVNNTAYATALYLKDCDECNSIDPSNNKININLNFGEDSEGRRNSLSVPKEINKELLVVAFYEEEWKAYSYIVFEDEKKQRAAKLMYFKDGGVSKRKLIPESNVLFREIHESYPEDKPLYRIQGEFVEYIHTNGTVGGTYPILK